MWREGNDQTIEIRNHSWLPEVSHTKVLPPKRDFPAETKLSLLIAASRNNWNFELIENSFQPYDAEAIKSIPLSTMP